MMGYRNTRPVGASSNNSHRSDWRVIKDLLPYLLEHRTRVIFAMLCLVAAKFANLGVPIVLKDLIDAMNIKPGSLQSFLIVPAGLIVGYGALRLAASLFSELRELLFAKVTQSAVRKIALQVFEHLHALSLQFHLGRQTGGVSRDIERGTRGIQTLVSFSLYSILPTIIEFVLVLAYFAYYYDIWFAVITFFALLVYIIFTIKVTEWRTHYRRTMNEMDSKANQRAIDSLLNFETVKYFGNEQFESRRYDENLKHYQSAAILSQQSLAILNLGQQAIIAIGLVLIMWRATQGVVDGSMTLGDLVLVNTLMIQLYIPLNFLGVIYREMKQSITDMDQMFTLLGADQEIKDRDHAKPLIIHNFSRGPEVCFEHVCFSYNEKREILKDISFTIPAGTITAVVGQSGAGKSTLIKLLRRQFTMSGGRIYIDDQFNDSTKLNLPGVSAFTAGTGGTTGTTALRWTIFKSGGAPKIMRRPCSAMPSVARSPAPPPPETGSRLESSGRTAPRSCPGPATSSTAPSPAAGCPSGRAA